MPGEKTGKNPENYEAVFSKNRLRSVNGHSYWEAYV